jgi:hypothetical protein
MTFHLFALGVAVKSPFPPLQRGNAVTYWTAYRDAYLFSFLNQIAHSFTGINIARASDRISVTSMRSGYSPPLTKGGRGIFLRAAKINLYFKLRDQ